MGETEQLEVGQVLDAGRETEEGAVVQVQRHQIVQRTCNT